MYFRQENDDQKSKVEITKNVCFCVSVQKVYVVIDIYGTTESVQITSTPSNLLSLTSSLSSSMSLSNSTRSRTNFARKQLPSNFISQQRKAENKCAYQQLCLRYLSRLALPGEAIL